MDGTRIEIPFAFCCAEGGGKIEDCDCINPDHGTAVVDAPPRYGRNWLRGATITRCTMGVGCDEAGVCYADAHGQPDQCPKMPPEPAPDDVEARAREMLAIEFAAAGWFDVARGISSEVYRDPDYHERMTRIAIRAVARALSQTPHAG